MEVIKFKNRGNPVRKSLFRGYTSKSSHFLIRHSSTVKVINFNIGISELFIECFHDYPTVEGVVSFHISPHNYSQSSNLTAADLTQLMPRDSAISSIYRKPGVFTKNIFVFIDRVFDPIARCSRLTKHFVEQQVTKKNRLSSQQR